jgi:hypothetical protein
MKDLTANKLYCWAKRMKVNNTYSITPYFPLVKIDSHISFTLLFICYIHFEEITAVNAHIASRTLRNYSG